MYKGHLNIFRQQALFTDKMDIKIFMLTQDIQVSFKQRFDAVILYTIIIIIISPEALNQAANLDK